MSGFFNDPSRCNVYVCESSVSARKALIDALRANGYKNVTGTPTPKDLLEILEVEPADWVLTSLDAGEAVNGLHILKLFAETPRFRHTRTSFLTRPGEDHVLPLAFELGLLSFHDRSMPSAYPDEIRKLLSALAEHQWSPTRTAATYLRRLLRDRRHFRRLLAFEQALLEVFPGDSDILLNIAEAQFLIGDAEAAQTTARQVSLLGPTYQARADELRLQHLGADGDDDTLWDETPRPGPCAAAPQHALNMLGVDTCLIVDPDTVVQHCIEQHLRQAGVPKIVACSTGEEAWRWIAGGGRPDLVIQEWRLPELSGPMLLQRLRQRGLISVPILVVSSLLKAADLSLVQEMGVSAVIEKPFEQARFFAEVIHALQQSKLPTEQISLERKIHQALELGNLCEARRLKAQYFGNERFDPLGRYRIAAEFAFHARDYLRTRRLALRVLKASADSLPMLNLLGKTLLKLGDFDAAVRCFAKAQSLSPKNVERLCELAMLALDQGDTTMAEVSLGEAKSLDANATCVQETESKVAIVTGDAERASLAMRQLESAARILSYMNNKAVALTRTGRFEDGIQLYRSTLASLPADWQQTRAQVLYNLGLAFARYSELQNALDALTQVQADPGSALERKAASLRRKICDALENRTSLVFGAPQPEPPAVEQPSLVQRDTEAPASGAEVNDDVADDDVADDGDIAAVEAGRGEIGCYRIFSARELTSPESITLMKNPPRFKERVKIERNEALQVRPCSA